MYFIVIYFCLSLVLLKLISIILSLKSENSVLMIFKRGIFSELLRFSSCTPQGVRKLWIFGQNLYLVFNSDQLQKILVTHALDYSKDNMSRLAQVIGYGLPLLEGNQWFKHKSAIQPLFHKQSMKAFYPIIVEIA